MLHRISLLSFPGWEEKPIDNSCFPHVFITGRRELPRIASEDSHVVRQVVIQSEVSALRVYRRCTVAGNVVDAKGLLHAKHGFEAPDPTVKTAKCLRAIIGFDPVPLSVRTPGILGAQTKGSIGRFPPDVCAVEIFLCSLQQATIRGADFQTFFWKI